MDASLATGVPCIFGVLTVENEQQALDRSGGQSRRRRRGGGAGGIRHGRAAAGAGRPLSSRPLKESLDITQSGLRTRLAREMAMQLVFVCDADGRLRDEAAEAVTSHAAADYEGDAATLHEARRRAVAAAKGVWSQWDEITATLARLAPQWPPHRMAASDRAVLRLAVWELLNTGAPAKAIIDEAIEVAKKYGTGDSYRFVNGILDAVLKEREALLAGL